MLTRVIQIGTARAAPPPLHIVMLPGAYHDLEDFVRAGFDQALAARERAVELVLAAPALAHLNDRGWLAPLRHEIIAPRRARGGELWLGGISLGAFMALRFAADSDEDLDGLCLLGPYLGSRIIAAEVAAQPADMRYSPAALADDDDERRVWHYVRGFSSRRRAPRVFAGYGNEDRFADTQRLLAQWLPPGSCEVLPGTHDWPVWRQLWDNFLDRHDRHGNCP